MIMNHIHFVRRPETHKKYRKFVSRCFSECRGSNLKKKATGSSFSGQWASTLSHPAAPSFRVLTFQLATGSPSPKYCASCHFVTAPKIELEMNRSSIFHPRFTLLFPFYVPVTIFSNFLPLQTWKYDRFESTNSNFKDATRPLLRNSIPFI